MLERHYLTSLFEPKTVAVIGASERENSVGSVIFRNILDSGFKGRLYPINPKHESIHGLAAYKSIEDIGARVELAIIATQPKTVPEIVEQCGRSGIKNIIIISAGFDAHYEDDLGGMKLLEKDYAWVTEELKRVADESAHGRIVLMLEGGYVLSSLARSVAAHIKVLAGL